MNDTREIAPIAVRPWTLNGLSERLIVSHYENEYGSAVRTLNRVRAELESLGTDIPAHLRRALKSEELRALGSVELHELYFAGLGGEGTSMPETARAVLEHQFGTVAAWRDDFARTAEAVAGTSAWVLLAWSRREERLSTQMNLDHSQGPVDAAPVLALDMYEHAYHLHFGANATAYVDAFMRNVNWPVVAERLDAVRAERPLPAPDRSDATLPSLSVEDLSAALADGDIQLVDARPRHYVSRTADQMAGAVWHDPDRIDEWVAELTPDRPVAVYCAYGFHVGCTVTRALREQGFDARYVRGGVSAWYAAGGARALRRAQQEPTRSWTTDVEGAVRRASDTAVERG